MPHRIQPMLYLTYAALVALPAIAAEQPLPDAPVLGYLTGNILSVGEMGPAGTDSSARTASIYRAELLPSRRDSGPVRRVVLPTPDYGSGDQSLRWRMMHGCLWYAHAPATTWISCFRIPEEELDYLDAANPRGIEALRRLKARPKDEPLRFALSSAYGWRMSPINKVSFDASIEGGGDGKAPIFYDFLPVAPDQVLLLVLEVNRLRVWRGRAKEPIRHRGWVVEWSSSEEETIAVNFKPEPFTIFGNPEVLYLVTQSGALYSLSEPKNGTRQVSLLWPGQRFPPSMVVVDENAKRYHAFWATGRDSEFSASYFEIGGEGKSANLTHLRPEQHEWRSADPMTRVNRAVHYLIDTERVSLPLPKNK